MALIVAAIQVRCHMSTCPACKTKQDFLQVMSSKVLAAGSTGSAHRGKRLTCLKCGTHQTPQWRIGPQGPRTMCNACGVKYKKELKERERKEKERKARQQVHLPASKKADNVS